MTRAETIAGAIKRYYNDTKTIAPTPEFLGELGRYVEAHLAPTTPAELEWQLAQVAQGRRPESAPRSIKLTIEVDP